MQFRPCIDIHNGKVKQIVGGSLSEKTGSSVVKENFVSDQDAAFFARFYMDYGIKGGHVIMLNKSGTAEYELTKKAALEALKVYPDSLQIGGGITDENAAEFIEAGASHVIVTSFVFKDGMINYDNLNKLAKTVGKKHLVLDLSCRKKDDKYYIVTDRWQKFTDTELTVKLLEELEIFADEYLIHAVDVEGKASGPDKELISVLGSYRGIPITYAGGISSYDDIDAIMKGTDGRVNITIGSALDLFGGKLDFNKIVEMTKISSP